MDGSYRTHWLIALTGSVLIVCLILLVFLTGNGSGRTITVDDDGGAEYERIQDAIDESMDGDIIRVWDGVYNENVIVNKSVSLIGNGTGNTTIDGGGVGDVVRITTDHVNMSGFMIVRSGNSSYDDYGVEILSDLNHIFEITCANNEIGIGILQAYNNLLERNTIDNNSRQGIILSHSINNLLSDNFC